MNTAVATVSEQAALTNDEPTTLLAAIARAASDPKVDVDKMERLWAMHERIVARQAEAAFNTAMALCQTEMGPIAANADNTQTKSKYATYGALDNALRPIYTKHGFSLGFGTGEGAPPEHVRIVIHVSHKDGHTRTEHIDMPADGKGAKGGDVMTKTHATGAAATYGRRYLLLMAFNLVVGEIDDDGNGASGGSITAAQKKELEDLIEWSGANRDKVLAYVGVENLEDMPAKKFKDAKAALERWIQKQRRGEKP